MKRDIPRPYKTPWEYAATWRAGDAYAGRRWAVLNISHNLFVSEFASEAEAKADIRERKKFHREAARAARQVAKGRPTPKKIAPEKVWNYVQDKQNFKFFKEIPFPA